MARHRRTSTWESGSPSGLTVAMCTTSPANVARSRRHIQCLTDTDDRLGQFVAGVLDSFDTPASCHDRSAGERFDAIRTLVPLLAGPTIAVAIEVVDAPDHLDLSV